jgi:hypothetical protein
LRKEESCAPPLKSNEPKTKQTVKARSHQNNCTPPPEECWDLHLGRLVDELVGDPSCDVFGIWGGQSEDDVLEAGFDALHAYFLDRLVPVCAQLLAAEAGEISAGMDAYELMRAIANLCVGADNDPRYDARRMVELLIAGLLQSRST